MKSKLLSATFAAMTLGMPASTQEVLFGDHYVTGNIALSGDICAGPTCGPIEPTSGAGVKIKNATPKLLFDSTGPNVFPDSDWSIFPDGTSPSDEYLVIQDETFNREPVKIRSGAPDNSLYVDTDGGIGLGTIFPEFDLHILSSVNSVAVFETTTNPYKWYTGANSEGFFIQDSVIFSVPFVIERAAPLNSLRVAENGDIGLGTGSPEGKLHTKGDGVQLAYFESGDGNAVQVRFRTDSENRRFLAVDNDDNVKSQIIFKDNEIQFTGATDSGANRWLTIGPTGILSQGGTCNVTPCDRTFDPEYFTVPPIEERAAYMWQNMHLPAIGPTTAGAPINLTEKTTGIIHELEVAHIYIEELHRELDVQTRRSDTLEQTVERQAVLLAEMVVRLNALEEQ